MARTTIVYARSKPSFKAAYSVKIQKPREEVFRFLATDYFENRPKWARDSIQLTKISPGPAHAGTEASGTAQYANGHIKETNVVVTEYVPGSRFVTLSRTDVTADAGGTTRRYFGRPQEIEMLFEEVPGGTRVKLSMKTELRDISTYGRLMFPFVRSHYETQRRTVVIRSLNSMAALLDGHSRAREIRGLAARVWSWWIVFWAIFGLLLLLYTSGVTVQLPDAARDLLRTLLIVMTVAAVVAFYNFRMMRKVFATS